MPPGHQHATRRRTHRVPGIVRRKPHALPGETVDVGSADLFLSVATQLRIAEIIREDENNVGLFGRQHRAGNEHAKKSWKDSNENKYKVVFTHPAFDNEVNKCIYELLLNYNENALILSPEDLIDWIPLMKKAQSIVSFDTGFVHLAYLYNNKVLSVGGQSFFWHFPDSEYINFNHIDNQGNVNSDVFHQSLNKVLNWIKND